MAKDSTRRAFRESIRYPNTNSLIDVIRESFYVLVDTSGDCWVWNHAVTRDGYGRPRLLGKNILAHRLSWLIEYGSIPDGMLVLHKCDNRRCVRPDHLFLGTHLDNSHDKMTKGRGVGNSNLTAEIVLEIRRRYAAGGVSRSALSREFGIPNTTVANVIRRVTWSWLSDDGEQGGES